MGSDVVGSDAVGADVEGSSVISGSTGLGSTVVGTDVVGSDVVGSEVVGSDVVGSEVVGAEVVGSEVVGSEVVGSEVVGTDVSGDNVGAKLVEFAVGFLVGLTVGLGVGTAVGKIVRDAVGDVVWCVQSPGLDSSRALDSSSLVVSPVRQSCRSLSQPQLKYTVCPSSDLDASPSTDRPFVTMQHDLLHMERKSGVLQLPGTLLLNHWQVLSCSSFKRLQFTEVPSPL